MDAAGILEQARSMLAANNLPINMANLNRAALAISRGETTLSAESGEDAAPQRSVQTRTRTQARPAVSPTTAPQHGFAGEQDALASAIDAQINAGGMGSNTPPSETIAPQSLNERRDAELAALPPGADLVAAFPGGSGGEGMTAGDAISTLLGDNMLPMAAAAMAPPIGAARGMFPNIRLGFNRPAIGGPSSAGRIAGGGADDAARIGNTPILPAPTGGSNAIPMPAPAAQRALPPSTRYNDAPPSRVVNDISSLTPAQRAAALGPGEASNATMTAARALANRRRSGGPRGQRTRNE